MNRKPPQNFGTTALDDVPEDAFLGPPSIYDREETEDDLGHWFDPPALEPLVDLNPQARASVDDRVQWQRAEQALARQLAAAADAVARLDERLLTQPSQRREGSLRHLALLEITDLVWAEGHRFRPERLALVDLERLGRVGDDAAVMGRATSALRRAISAPRKLSDPETVATALGYRTVAEPGNDDMSDPIRELLPEMGRDHAEAWLSAVKGLDAHPIVRAGFGFRLWPRMAMQELLEPATLAGHLALAPARIEANVGLTFLPLALGRPPAALRYGGMPESFLAAWFDAVAGASIAGRARLSALADWRERVANAIQGMRGRGAPSLADLFLARPVLSASAVAAELGLTGTRSRDLLNAFERRGLVREMTGQGRFRFWQPRL
ncbi:MAG: helix-turn-helix domain-containing protein [Pseudomonadota bacterium]